MLHVTAEGTRRDFLRQSAILGGLGVLGTWPRSLRGAAAPSEKIRLGFIGLGGQGNSNLGALMKYAVALCDVDTKRLGAAQARVLDKTKTRCATYSDYRKLLESKDVDAVVVSTPDHWHALITIDACQAGKHVYCEKPLTLTIAEGRAMVKAARKHKCIVQTGSQQRSDSKFRLACELVRNGKLGKIKTVKVGLAGVNFKGPAVPNSDPPAELDYDFWLGPAPKVPYNPKHVHYNFRFFWDYSGGQQTNWGAHHLDITQWALGMDESGPIEVEGKARYNANKWYEVPEWTHLVYKYANGVVVHCGQDFKMGATFEGEKGTLHVNRGKLEASDPDLLKQKFTDQDTRLYVSSNHHNNWLDCIRTGKLPICDVEIGHRSATVCHLGNLAVRTGRKITWDPAREEVVGDSEAAKMVSRPYRAPWKLPSL